MTEGKNNPKISLAVSFVLAKKVILRVLVCKKSFFSITENSFPL